MKIMKKLIFIFMVFFVGSTPGMSAQTPTNPPNVNTTLQPQPPGTTPNPWDKGDKKEKDPSYIIYCVISLEEGIQTDIPLFGVTGYEIWDKDESVCISYFNNERSFVNALFMLASDEYVIKLSTSECVYSGIVFIP